MVSPRLAESSLVSAELDMMIPTMTMADQVSHRRDHTASDHDYLVNPSPLAAVTQENTVSAPPAANLSKFLVSPSTTLNSSNSSNPSASTPLSLAKFTSLPAKAIAVLNQ